MPVFRVFVNVKFIIVFSVCCVLIWHSLCSMSLHQSVTILLRNVGWYHVYCRTVRIIVWQFAPVCHIWWNIGMSLGSLEYIPYTYVTLRTLMLSLASQTTCRDKWIKWDCRITSCCIVHSTCMSQIFNSISNKLVIRVIVMFTIILYHHVVISGWLPNVSVKCLQE